MPHSDEHAQTAVTVVVFCVVDDHAKLLDLVRADVCDAGWKTQAARAGNLFQFQGSVGKATTFPRKRLDVPNKNIDANDCRKTSYKTKGKGKVYELLNVLNRSYNTTIVLQKFVVIFKFLDFFMGVLRQFQ